MNLRALFRAQDRMMAALGRAPGDRAGIVNTMLSPADGERTGYWLQLVISAMLATLGLALNSSAVVIGAMLIAPLMRPLVEVAMGLATGSTALTVRATARVVMSVAVVVVVSMAIAWRLPFHTITSELEARTAPTLLDLFIAGACALAAAYATLRADAEIATTAAGTSIGISLVPPLCAIGYGLALRDLTVARGAALLFTANLSGILAIAAGVFVLTGFARVDVRAGERTFESRLGPLYRVVPPLLLVGIVFLPLHRALGEIQHRAEISQAVAKLLDTGDRKIVEYSLDQTASAVVLRVVIVGDNHAASQLDGALRQRLATVGVDQPRISVWAVPDASSLSALTRRIDEIPPPQAPEPASQTVHRYSSDLAKLVRDAWPTAGTGELLDVQLDLDHPDRVVVRHLGAPLGPSGTQLLAHALEHAAGKLTVDEDALAPVEAPATDAVQWLPAAISLVERARREHGLHVCVTMPKAKAAAATRAIITQYLGPDAGLRDGDDWAIEVDATDCPDDFHRGSASSAP